MLRVRLALAAALLMVVFPQAGCGSHEATPQSAAAVAQAFADARNRRDIAATCALYTSGVKAQMERGYGGCEAFYRQQAAAGHPGGPRPVKVADIHRSGNRATGLLVVTNANGRTTSHITLIREGENWRVASFQF
jgi:hypothetical protein